MIKTRAIYLLFWLCCLPAGLSASNKIDTIYLQSGDRITGEVKYMEDNQLRLSTDDAGSIDIQWNSADSIYILTSMRILLQSGEILYGKLLPSGQHQVAELWHREGDPRLVALKDIVALSPMRDKVLDRMDGSLSSGFSYVKANKLMQVNVDALLQYNAEKNYFELFYNAIATSEPSGGSQRQDAGATFRRLFPSNWFLISQFSMESNSELEVDLRTNLGAGIGHSLKRSNIMHFFWEAGMQVNREATADLTQFNAEGIGSVNYSLFIYDEPEVSLSIVGTVFPSLNNLGRVRSDVKSTLKWEIFNDLFLKWSFYYTYDSSPLSSNAAKNDWALTLLGLEYKL